jgi:hypothetical protein
MAVLRLKSKRCLLVSTKRIAVLTLYVPFGQQPFLITDAGSY